MVEVKEDMFEHICQKKKRRREENHVGRKR